jgi:nitrate reductase cytochrome c-type subunit
MSTSISIHSKLHVPCLSGPLLVTIKLKARPKDTVRTTTMLLLRVLENIRTKNTFYLRRPVATQASQTYVERLQGLPPHNITAPIMSVSRTERNCFQCHRVASESVRQFQAYERCSVHRYGATAGILNEDVGLRRTGSRQARYFQMS